jgi:hypothetical protein
MATTVASEWRLTGIIALDDRLPAVSSVYRASTLDPKAVVPPHLRSSPKEVIAVGEIKSGSSALCVTVALALRLEESQTTMSAARARTRGVGRLLCPAGAAGGKERAPKRTPAGISPAPPGVVASLRSLAPSHKVRKTHSCFPLRPKYPFSLLAGSRRTKANVSLPQSM